MVNLSRNRTACLAMEIFLSISSVFRNFSQVYGVYRACGGLFFSADGTVPLVPEVSRKNAEFHARFAAIAASIILALACSSFLSIPLINSGNVYDCPSSFDFACRSAVSCSNSVSLTRRLICFGFVANGISSFQFDKLSDGGGNYARYN